MFVRLVGMERPSSSSVVVVVVTIAASLAIFIGWSWTSPSEVDDCSAPPRDASETESENYVCEHQYALCTSAPCVPEPGDSNEAICFCDVEEGKSLSTEPCESVRPRTDANGIRTVYSAFSLDQFYAGKKAMKCDSGTPWTWCLNKRCTVYPYDPTRAICTCDVKRTGEWMTLGGDCNPTTCETAYWSGAPIPAFEDAAETMKKALGLEKSPVKWCE
jgi:hypothetical protein